MAVRARRARPPVTAPPHGGRGGDRGVGHEGATGRRRGHRAGEADGQHGSDLGRAGHRRPHPRRPAAVAARSATRGRSSTATAGAAFRAAWTATTWRATTRPAWTTTSRDTSTRVGPPPAPRWPDRRGRPAGRAEGLVPTGRWLEDRRVGCRRRPRHRWSDRLCSSSNTRSKRSPMRPTGCRGDEADGHDGRAEQHEASLAVARPAGGRGRSGLRGDRRGGRRRW